MLIMDLTHALELYPPPQPTRAAVDLLVTVGKHQEYLVTHGLLPPHDHPGSLDALKVRSTNMLSIAVISNSSHISCRSPLEDCSVICYASPSRTLACA